MLASMNRVLVFSPGNGPQGTHLEAKSACLDTEGFLSGVEIIGNWATSSYSLFMFSGRTFSGLIPCVPLPLDDGVLLCTFNFMA